MTTNIVKRMDGRSLITQDDYAFIRDFCSKIIADLWNLTLMPNQNPLLRENSVLLLGKNFRGNKILLFERFRSGRESFSRLAESWYCLCLRHWHVRMLHVPHVHVN